MPSQDDEFLDGIDAPRRMPASLRQHLEAELTGDYEIPADETAALLSRIDGPRPLPDLTRMRLTRALMTTAAARRPPAFTPKRRFGAGWGAAAAIAVAVVSSFAVVPERAQVVGPGEFFGATDIPDRLFSSNEPVPEAAGVGKPGFGPAPAPPGPPPEGPAAALSPLPAAAPEDPAPPFAFSDEPGRPFAAAATAPLTTAAPPFRIDVVPGDADAVAGFRAYVNTRNALAAPSSRRLEIVAPGQAADITVNLSGTPLTTMSTGVGIETLLAPDRLLRDNVFNFAGAVDRQAALLVNAVYPTAAPGSTAVIYREPDGVLRDDVPAALEASLKEKGVTVLPFVDVRPGQAIAPVSADAVFLSLHSAAAKRVVDAYSPAAYPPRRFNGIGTLAESSAVADLPPGTRFVSPYAFPASAEAAAVKQGTGLPAGAQVYHGWIAAKTLAVAVWRDDPRTPEQLKAALHRMANYANGFAPVYTYRPGTNSVQPEGVLFEVGEDTAAQIGDFLTR